MLIRLEGLSLDVTQVLRGSPGEALVGQLHVLLPDAHGTVQTLAGQLKVIRGHLNNGWRQFGSQVVC